MTVFLALVQSGDRRTLTGLVRRVLAQFSLAGLSPFLSRAPWSDTVLGQKWLAHFRTQLEPPVQVEHRRRRASRLKRRRRPQATSVTGYVIFDDSTHLKPKGR